jgi:hypothetical protein
LLYGKKRRSVVIIALGPVFSPLLLKLGEAKVISTFNFFAVLIHVWSCYTYAIRYEFINGY